MAGGQGDGGTGHQQVATTEPGDEDGTIRADSSIIGGCERRSPWRSHRGGRGGLAVGNGADMSYLLETETVYANAFHPLGKFGTYLSQDEINLFCHIVGEELVEVAGRTEGTEGSSVRFDLSVPLSEGMSRRFVVVAGHVLRLGPAVSDDELSSCNLRLGDDDAIRTALAQARERFAGEIGTGRRPALAWLIMRG